MENEDLGKAFYEKLTDQSGIRLIDFENFNNNSFHVATELTYKKDDEEIGNENILIMTYWTGRSGSYFLKAKIKRCTLSAAMPFLMPLKKMPPLSHPFSLWSLSGAEGTLIHKTQKGASNRHLLFLSCGLQRGFVRGNIGNKNIHFVEFLVQAFQIEFLFQ